MLYTLNPYNAILQLYLNLKRVWTRLFERSVIQGTNMIVLLQCIKNKQTKNTPKHIGGDDV